MVTRKLKRCCLVLAMVLLTILSMYLLSEFLRWRLPQKESEEILKKDLGNEMVSSSANTTSVTRKSILLLIYTPLFGTKGWFKKNDDCSLNGTRKTSCTKNMLEVTEDKRRFTESDFVMFHASDMPRLHDLKTIIKDKSPSQFWIYFTQEAPTYTPDTTPMDGMFDLTYTYRSDSDFVGSRGAYEEIPFASSPQQDFSVGKDKLVSWMVSNCKPTLRLSFVRKLKKYIAVDVFGRCWRGFGQYRPACPRKQKACKSMLKQYKFYLSFENALCEDYITEKYWWHLEEDNVVPIVMGGANYTKLAIPGSYINVLDFMTMKDLADYLHYLDKNNTAYNEYFKWRLRYRVAKDVPAFCYFCETVNSKTWTKPTGNRDLTAFWVTQGKCHAKDQKVLDMWTYTTIFPFPAFCFTCNVLFLIVILIIGLMIYFIQVYKVALHVTDMTQNYAASAYPADGKVLKNTTESE